MASKNQLVRARKIVQSDGVVLIKKEKEWNVQGSNDSYKITIDEGGLKTSNAHWLCEKLDQDDSTEICKGWLNCAGEYSRKTCSHVEAVKLFIMQEETK